MSQDRLADRQSLIAKLRVPEQPLNRDRAEAADCIEQLEREVTEMTEERNELERVVERLGARLAEAKRDAERYQWLRDVYNAHEHRIFLSPQGAFREDQTREANCGRYAAAPTGRRSGCLHRYRGS